MCLFAGHYQLVPAAASTSSLAAKQSSTDRKSSLGAVLCVFSPGIKRIVDIYFPTDIGAPGVR